MAIKVTELTYDDFISSGVVLLDIKTEWCGPCKALSPIIDELANEYSNIRVGKMDADENPNVSSRLSIRSIPTILIYKNGEVVEKHVGGASKTQIKSMIDKHLNDN
jgi:thioredoxin 1